MGLDEDLDEIFDKSEGEKIAFMDEKEFLELLKEGGFDWEKEAFKAMNRARLAFMLAMEVFEAVLEVIGMPEEKRSDARLETMEAAKKRIREMYHVQVGDI